MTNVSKCFSCARKNDYDPKFGYYGCKLSGQECKDYSMFEPKTKPKPTNADRIRSMSDEKLAEAFANSCPADNSRNRCCQYFGKGTNGCRDCWLDWLRKEAEP